MEYYDILIPSFYCRWIFTIVCGVGGNLKSENWKWVIWMLINRLIDSGWQRPFWSKSYIFLSVCQGEESDLVYKSIAVKKPTDLLNYIT